MRRIAIAIAVLFGLIGSACAQPAGSIPRSTLQSDIATDFPDNNVGQITPQVLRSFLTTFSNSTVFFQTDLGSGVPAALGIASNAAGGFVSVPNTNSCVYQNSASAVAGCGTILPSGLTIPYLPTLVGGGSMGNAVSRSYALKLADFSSVIDTGADPTDTNSSQSAFTNIASDLGALGIAIVPAGTYDLPSQPTYGQTLFLGVGGQLSAWPTGVDVSIAETTPLWSYRQLAATSGNQFGPSFFAYIPSTGASASYERAGFVSRIATADVSTIGSNNFDAVAGYFLAEDIASVGSIFGQNVVAQYDSGGGGVGTIAEGDSVNNASTAGLLGSNTNRNGWTAVADGSFNSTAAFAAMPGSALWRDGFDVEQAGISDEAFRLIGTSFDYFDIGASGNVTQENSAADVYHTFVLESTQAYTIGIKNSDSTFDICAVQGLGSDCFFKMTSSGAITASDTLAVGAGSAITSSGPGGALTAPAFQSGAVASRTCTVDQAKTLIFTNGILTGGTCNT